MGAYRGIDTDIDIDRDRGGYNIVFHNLPCVGLRMNETEDSRILNGTGVRQDH